MRTKVKEWVCIQVNHHNDVGNAIMEMEGKGWRLNSYQAMGQPLQANHYLLFERGA